MDSKDSGNWDEEGWGGGSGGAGGGGEGSGCKPRSRGGNSFASTAAIPASSSLDITRALESVNTTRRTGTQRLWAGQRDAGRRAGVAMP